MVSPTILALRLRARVHGNSRGVFGAFGCVLGACVQAGSPVQGPNTAAAEILWLPAGVGLEDDLTRPVFVRNGRSIFVHGSGAVVFSVTADCAAVATEITKHFEHTQWQQRSTQELNPGLATSFSSGCRSRGGCAIQLDSNGRLIPHEPYNDWHGEWENQRGDIVTYDVGGTGRRLNGYASYVPRNVLEGRIWVGR